MDDVIYIYDHAVEPKEITKRKIRNEIDDFLSNTTISQFKNLGWSKELALKERLYTYCVVFGEHTRYHPRTYLESMDEEDIENILNDINANGGSIMTSKPTNENFDDFSENIFQDLIDEGYNGAELLAEFRNRKAQMRNATQSLVQEAKTKGKRTTIEDLFKEENEDKV